MTRRFRYAALLLGILTSACPRPNTLDPAEPTTAPASHDCLTVIPELEHMTYRELSSRGLVANGVTWAALLRAALNRHATVLERADGPIAGAPAFGHHLSVNFEGATTWVAQDDEAGTAIICAGSPELMSRVRREFQLAWTNKDALLRLVHEADPDEME